MQQTIRDISVFYNRPCKFKLKSGKEVYGVIWENHEDGFHRHYFASPMGYFNYLKAQESNDLAACARLIEPVDVDQIIGAEWLDRIAS